MKKILCIVCVFIIGGLLGCREEVPIAYKIRFHVEGEGQVAVMPVSGVGFNIENTPVIWEGDIEEVGLITVDLGRCVSFRLNERGMEQLERVEGRNVILLINEQAMGFAKVEGEMLMFLEVRDSELEGFVEELNKSLEG